MLLIAKVKCLMDASYTDKVNVIFQHLDRQTDGELLRLDVCAKNLRQFAQCPRPKETQKEGYFAI